GVDAKRLPALPGLPPAPGCPRRIQRQVHGQPAGPSWRLLRDPSGPHPRHLPQFFLSAPTLAIHGPAPCLGARLMFNPNARDLSSEGFAVEEEEFLHAVVDGLSRPRKTLPCRFFYDARGSELFEEITRLVEYYPTRTEATILAANAAAMAEGVPSGGVLVEFGSGSSVKTEILLKELPHLGAYVSIDVSPSALKGATARLTARFPGLD